MTVNCGERGLLLLRVRDEARQVVAAYRGLYESSVAYGMRKALMAEQRKAELSAKVRRRGVRRGGRTSARRGTQRAVRTRTHLPRRPPVPPQIKILSAEVADLEKQAEALSSRCDDMEAGERERFGAEEAKHGAEVAKLKAINEQLKESLDALLAPPSAKK